ncbi:MAG TPA: SURF1 family protein [Gemmatimonadales bacterium]|nr:SURF1 family protein [Gemmatimonadales bacterium]
MMPDRRDGVALVAALLIAALCVWAGVWQLDRLHQRRARNDLVLARRARPPLDVRGGPLLTADSARDRRLRARGRYDYAHERFWRPRSYEGVPGVALVTPLRLADSAAVLVDRGWVPSPDAYHVDQDAYREADSADVVGLGMKAPRGRGDVDPAALADSLPYPLLPFVLQELPTTRPPPSGMIRWPIPEISDGPHLSYAIQWFSFAAIIVVGSLVLVRKRASGRPKPPHLAVSGYH